ncbi:MAG: dephospho-CoA kinase [Candidatus Omnitrophota bacterium]|nr:dephospho-CoA kinase [Candidatus Omnitrophota bacterium]
MHAIGITGSFGTGKTTVARLFARCGARIINADRLAHQIIKKGKPAYRKIISLFGQDILKSDGEINRARLAGKVFKSSSLVAKLNKIVHPEVIRQIKKDMARARLKRQTVIIDVPLLIEAGLFNIVDKLIVVKASKANQMKRLKIRSGIPKAKIIQRIKAQLPLKQKQRMADFVVDNNGSLTYTKKQIIEIWGILDKEVK